VARSGAGKGLKAMFAGQVDVAGVARALTAEERAARPFVAIIGYDGLAVLVNEANPVRALSREQVKALFTGTARTWRQVGGRDLPVVACTERLASERATLTAFRELALDGAAYGPVVEREDPADCVRLVASDPAAVAAASVALAVHGTRAVTVDGVDPVPERIRDSAYPLTRPLLLVTRAPPEGSLGAFVDFMTSPEGQAAVARAGFVAAR
jgi:phosphate transport system substrate-binding protein